MISFEKIAGEGQFSCTFFVSAATVEPRFLSQEPRGKISS